MLTILGGEYNLVAGIEIVMAVCVEILDVRAMFFFLIPHMARSKPTTFYVFDASARVLKAATIVARLFKCKVEPLRFRAVDLKDESGMRIGVRVRYFDVAQVQADILSSSSLVRQMAAMPELARIFLAKRVATQAAHDPLSLARVLYLIQVVKWKSTKENWGKTRLFLRSRLWKKPITRYGEEFGIEVVFSRYIGGNSLSDTIREILGDRNLERYRYISKVLRSVFEYFLTVFSPSKDRHQIPLGTYVATESYGALCLDHPEYHSDLFFWQQSDLRSRNSLLIFSGIDILDSGKWRELREKGINAVASKPLATIVQEAPVYIPTNRYPEIRKPTWYPKQVADSEVGCWITREVNSYLKRCNHWEDFFEQLGIMVYVLWFKHTPDHCAMADALQKLGGVLAVYQRSYEDVPNAGLMVGADIEFGFSKGHAEVERMNNSVIPYHITTGYIGDHRFPLLRKQADIVRKQIIAHGAERIVAYCDEGSMADGRWERDHQSIQENYAFLLEKVLEESWLGLVIKPKAPRTLNERLGPVADLLDRAKATGRCHIYAEGSIHSIHPPALAAMSADVTIHENLAAGTAGIQSALAGTPTLLLDLDGWKVSDLYRLEVGKVVFLSWDSIWEACLGQWEGGAINGFGEWGSILDDLDPFRDGRAAERVGTYLRWLIDSLVAGDSREKALVDAADRYRQAWGSDKVTEVNGN